MVLDQISSQEIPVIFLAGVIAFLGYVGSRIMKRMNIPTAAGFILSGMILGNLFVHRYFPDFPMQFRILSDFALGLIGLQIGTELDLSHVRKYFKNLAPLLFIETVGTFLFVSLVMTIWFTSLHLGVLFGAIAAATAPAVTVRVIMEMKAEGPLTRTVYFLLASDDLVALIIAVAILETALGPWISPVNQLSVSQSLMITLQELFWTVILGVTLGFVFDYIAERENELEDLIALIIAVMLILVGFSELTQANVILASMIIGVIHSNWGHGKREEVVEKIETITMPIVVFFFILVGLDFDASLLTHSLRLEGFQDWQFMLIAVVIVYTVARSAAKIVMGYLGAVAGKVPPEIRDNVGFTLLSQGGVALGIAFLAFERLSDAGNPELGLFILSVLAISTVVTELIGVFAAQFALKRANEHFSFQLSPGDLGQDARIIDTHWLRSSLKMAAFIQGKLGQNAVKSIYWAPHSKSLYKGSNFLVIVAGDVAEKVKKEILSDVSLFDEKISLQFLKMEDIAEDRLTSEGWQKLECQ